MVQSNHATRGITASYPQGQGVPNIVLIGVPNLAALERVRAKLAANQIPHYCFHEPDHDFGFTSIATAALGEEDRHVFANYRVWSYGRGVEQSTCGVTPDSPTNSPLAQAESAAL
jgi:hypothetical protein